MYQGCSSVFQGCFKGILGMFHLNYDESLCLVRIKAWVMIVSICSIKCFNHYQCWEAFSFVLSFRMGLNFEFV